VNIFVLDRDPAIAAAMHCDQHLHKMILESAQMLSTAVRYYCSYLKNFNGYYKPTHINHPCTSWVADSRKNAAWLVQLCYALEAERQAACNCAEHASMQVIKLFESDALEYDCTSWPMPTRFVFACPAGLVTASSESVPALYQSYYRFKNRQWSISNVGPMTWKNRSVPQFMTEGD